MKTLLTLLLSAWATVPAAAAEASSPGAERVRFSGGDGNFAGPAATTSQLAEDDAEKAPALRIPWFDENLQPWFDFKSRLNQNHGLQLGVAYTYLHQAAMDAPDGAEDDAGSAVLRLSGSLALLESDNGNTGRLVFSGDNRHRYTDIAPADLGFSTGYLGIPGTLFSDIDTVLGDLNWQQSLNGGRSGIIIGRYDPNDFFDVLGYANPWTSFQNLAVLFNATIALPDWSTGAGIGHWFNEQWYAKAAVNDVNAAATDIKLFTDWDELYTTAEIGWSPTREQRFLSNVHVTGWHADEREHDGIEESEGVAIGANWTLDESWMPFIKAGWSDGTAPLYNESVTAGMIYHVAHRSDLWGLGINWGSPADDALNDQVSNELFYRLQLAQNLAVTPSAQLILDPALNPEESALWIAGIRARFTF